MFRLSRTLLSSWWAGSSSSKEEEEEAAGEEKYLLKEFVLHGLAEYSLLSKQGLESGLQFKDLQLNKDVGGLIADFWQKERDIPPVSFYDENIKITSDDMQALIDIEKIPFVRDQKLALYSTIAITINKATGFGSLVVHMQNLLYFASK